jgi:hypothetical protein
VREWGGLTHKGFWAIMRGAYDGFSVARAELHLSGVKASLLLETPVGRPMIRIFDHFTLACV